MIFRIQRGSLRLHENPKNVFSGELLKGFVIENIFKSKHLGYGVYGFLFQSMKRSDVNECINSLKDEGIFKQQGFYRGKELYKISDELHNFLMDRSFRTRTRYKIFNITSREDMMFLCFQQTR